MSQELLYSLLRKLLTVLGTFLVQRGWVGENDMLEISAGLAVLIGSVLWSWYQRRQDDRQLKVAIAAPPGTSVAEIKQITKDIMTAPPVTGAGSEHTVKS